MNYHELSRTVTSSFMIRRVGGIRKYREGASQIKFMSGYSKEHPFFYSVSTIMNDLGLSHRVSCSDNRRNHEVSRGGKSNKIHVRDIRKGISFNSVMIIPLGQ
jgi:hypothetical protein